MTQGSEGDDGTKAPHDQRQLELLGLEEVYVTPEPWGGQSPRELTGAFKRFSLGALPAGGLRGLPTVCKKMSAGPAASSQLDLFLFEGG